MSQWLGAGHASGLRRDPTTFLEGHDRIVELKEYDRRVSVEDLLKQLRKYRNAHLSTASKNRVRRSHGCI